MDSNFKSDKEINSILYDQLTIVERLERASEKGCFEEEVKIIKNEISRKQRA